MPIPLSGTEFPLSTETRGEGRTGPTSLVYVWLRETQRVIQSRTASGWVSDREPGVVGKARSGAIALEQDTKQQLSLGVGVR